MDSKSKDNPYYIPKITHLDPVMEQILERKVANGEPVLMRVQQLRDKAWDMFPYPCIGLFSFVNTQMPNLPYYREVVERLTTTDQRFLDLGCGFGQDIRRLMFEGVPSSRLTGIDVTDAFIELGFQLFQDRVELRDRFLIADVTEELPAELSGKFHIIYCGMFFHLWGWEDQKIISKRVIKLLNLEKGSMIFGFQLGSVTGHERRSQVVASGNIYKHNPQSLNELWEEIGQETGTKWKVKACIDSEGPEIAVLQQIYPDNRKINFSIELL